MPIVLVSVNGEPPAHRTVDFRTSKPKAGTLCEVWADDRMQLCMIERTVPTLVVRRLPEMLRSAICA